jgi:hypothetical protein
VRACVGCGAGGGEGGYSPAVVLLLPPAACVCPAVQECCAGRVSGAAAERETNGIEAQQSINSRRPGLDMRATAAAGRLLEPSQRTHARRETAVKACQNTRRYIPHIVLLRVLRDQVGTVSLEQRKQQLGQQQQLTTTCSKPCAGSLASSLTTSAALLLSLLHAVFVAA